MRALAEDVVDLRPLHASVTPEVESLEAELLLEAVFRHRGYDFRGYAPASIRRRLRKRATEEGLPTLSALQDRALHDSACMDRLLADLSVNVTSLFRDPTMYRALREKVVPLLRTYPFLRIWSAGCATGEETWSLAILLHEEGLYDRCRIYATDINAAVLERAASGVFPASQLREDTARYDTSGGRGALADHYEIVGDSVRFRPELGANMVFARHNLVSDRSFNEFQLILCRNVLIYFGRPLQDRVHELLYESLAMFGVLVLGHRETVRFTRHERVYEQLDAEEKLYRRVR